MTKFFIANPTTNKYSLRRYNGVNHDVKIVNNPDDYAVNRKGQYFLTKPLEEIADIEVVGQAKPLSVQDQLSAFKCQDSQIFLPQVWNTRIEILPEGNNYDMIIVSNLYADIARQKQASNPMCSQDYLDRLYIPIPLYTADPENSSEWVQKVASVGFRKAWTPRTPQEYVMDLRNGMRPSVASMQACLEIYKNQGVYCDYNTSCWIQELETRLLNICWGI